MSHLLTLYTHYKPSIEMSGYILLVVAAFLNQNARLQQLNRAVELQARELSQQAGELEILNSSLEQRVSEQVNEIGRLARLKRFLAPEVARMITEEQEKSLLGNSSRPGSGASPAED